MKMTPAQERMEKVYAETPGIGRVRLANRAGVSHTAAQTFLASKKYASEALPKLTDYEQSLISKGLKAPLQAPPASFEWSKSFVKFAAMGDSHTGHVMSHKEWWDKMCSRIDNAKCEFALHTGDITEGMSGRAGHVYELEAIGATAQLDLASQRISMIPCPVRGITGNHDLWGYKAIGFDPGEELAKRCSNFEYLGQQEATIRVGNVNIMLSHPLDGSAYAVSYSPQQFINALSGGEKPHILLMGHHHKSIYFSYRNVQAFETGTLCAQTQWMRGKRIQAAPGFWIIELWMCENGIERLRPEWVPFYS